MTDVDQYRVPLVLDPIQLHRIERTHRGFLYQHLFAVGCLLLSQNSDTRSIFVERDEDIELVTSEFRIYIQVKTRSRGLAKSDIDGALIRFDKLREEHSSGARTLLPKLALL